MRGYSINYIDSRYHAVDRQGTTTLWRSWTMNEENQERSPGPCSVSGLLRRMRARSLDITPRPATTVRSHSDFVIHARLQHVPYADKMDRKCQGLQRNAGNSLRNPQSTGCS